jgi:hypothetical protein
MVMHSKQFIANLRLAALAFTIDAMNRAYVEMMGTHLPAVTRG